MEIYLVGGWQKTGPGYNDVYFCPDIVTVNESKAREYLSAGRTVFVAEDGDEFIDWQQLQPVTTSD